MVFIGFAKGVVVERVDRNGMAMACACDWGRPEDVDVAAEIIGPAHHCCRVLVLPPHTSSSSVSVVCYQVWHSCLFALKYSKCGN